MTRVSVSGSAGLSAPERDTEVLHGQSIHRIHPVDPRIFNTDTAANTAKAGNYLT
jgi:hypothetical protein